jgi:hypothetical protein
MYALLYPMLTLILFTFICVFISIFARVHALREGHLKLHEFSLMNFSADQSAFVTKSSRNLDNLFQVPILFYICTILLMLLGDQNTYFLVLSWLFVGSRIINSLIHVTYNDFIHRLTAFMVGNSILFVIALMLLVASVK